MPFFCEKWKNCIFLIFFWQFWHALLLAVSPVINLQLFYLFSDDDYVTTGGSRSESWWVPAIFVHELHFPIWRSKQCKKKKVGNRFFVHFLMIRGVVMQFFFCFVCLFYLVFCFFHKKKYSPVGLSSMQFFVVVLTDIS